MAPIMRDGVEYEFTTLFDLDVHHQAQASKDRTQMFADKIFQITEDTGALFRQWLGQEINESARAGMGFETQHGQPVNASTDKISQ